MTRFLSMVAVMGLLLMGRILGADVPELDA